ncbi:MAG TPA: ferrous iron transport protein A [Candidatus Bathyarchaeota archaeon]|nr:ferrous iron transport protein A [Candidatus Bathyarchaeota archaeon]HEX69069.1 ferrous iron transport protein A [Candidatus Bathyarchaeota archaeon]
MSLKVPLAFLSENKQAEIVEVIGGRGLVRRLYELGFIPGTKVRVISSNSPGPVLVDIKGTRMALGRGVTMKIIVNME